MRGGPRIATRNRSARPRVCAVRANADAKGTKPATPLLDTINYAAHMKNLSATQLKQLAQEVRVTVCGAISYHCYDALFL